MSYVPVLVSTVVIVVAVTALFAVKVIAGYAAENINYATKYKEIQPDKIN